MESIIIIQNKTLTFNYKIETTNRTNKINYLELIHLKNKKSRLSKQTTLKDNGGTLTKVILSQEKTTCSLLIF